MPDAYRKTLVRQISQHAHSEVVGMLPEGNWITRAPSLKRKAILHLPKYRMKQATAYTLYSAAETLGVSREETINELHNGKAKYSSIFNYPTLTWADIGAIGMARRRSRHHEPGNALQNIFFTVRMHGQWFAFARKKASISDKVSIFFNIFKGQRRPKTMCQDAINRWWWLSLMMFWPKGCRFSTLTKV